MKFRSRLLILYIFCQSYWLLTHNHGAVIYLKNAETGVKHHTICSTNERVYIIMTIYTTLMKYRSRLLILYILCQSYWLRTHNHGAVIYLKNAETGVKHHTMCSANERVYIIMTIYTFLTKYIHERSVLLVF